MNIKFLKAALLVVAAMCCKSALSEVRLPAVLSDGAVLQRNCPIVIWGTGTPGEPVEIVFNKKKAKTNVLADSTWSAQLPPMKAGGPYKLRVNDLEVDDILIGDLYLCSGQSNMELMVSRTMDFFKDEVSSYNNPKIREFKVAKEYAFHGGRNDVSTSEWKKAVPGTSERFGALVYFMAKELYEKNGHVPVGIVNSSWGGTKIEAWISENALSDYPVRLHKLRISEDDEYRSALGRGERRAQSLWYRTMDFDDPGYKGPVNWNRPEFDDSDWIETDLMDSKWGIRDGKALNGSHWLRKTVNVADEKDGKGAELRLGCIVDADSVWVNGKFVGNTTYQYPPRIYKIPSGVLHKGGNLVCIRVVSNGGTPHFVPDKPHKIIYDDGSEISLEGKWRHKAGAMMPPTPSVTDFFQTPSVLYNSMIHPLAHLPFRGVVWYQGESDVDIRFEYASLLKSLITDWRATFSDEELPFYIVELADFLHESDVNGRKSWQEMRESQRKAADESASAWWVRNGDIGEWNDIHPRDKKTPGIRVATKILEHPHK